MKTGNEKKKMLDREDIIIFDIAKYSLIGYNTGKEGYMMKKYLKHFILFVMTLTIIFCAAACNSQTPDTKELDELKGLVDQLSNQIADLEKETSSNTADIDLLKKKVEALETANTVFSQRLSELEKDSKTCSADISTLQSELDELTNQVSNATHIERVVVTQDNIESHDFVYNFYGEYKLNNDNTAITSIQCGMFLKIPFTSYQLIRLNYSLTIDNQTENSFFASMRNEVTSSGLLAVNRTFNEPISISNSSKICASLDSAVFYSFY